MVNKICVQCKESYAKENNDECEFCIMMKKVKKCIKCNKFCAVRNNKCSQCDLYDEHKDYTIDYIKKTKYQSLDKRIFAKIVHDNQDKVGEIFKIYNKKHKLYDPSYFDILSKKSVTEICATLNGWREYPPLALLLKDAVKLCEFLMKNNNDDYRFVHAIFPFVIDKWNINNDVYKKVGGAVCYYDIDEGGVPNRGITLNLIPKWKVLHGCLMWGSEVGHLVIYDCPICLVEMERNDYPMLVECGRCYKIFHKNCVNTCKSCPLCKYDLSCWFSDIVP